MWDPNKPPTIARQSASVTRLRMFFNETHLSDGTGFFWKYGDEIFVITNWHNVTGRNPDTGKHLSSTAAEPNAVEVQIFSAKGKVFRCPRRIELYVDDAPVWFEHPILREKVDVVAIPTGLSEDVIYPLNGFDLSNDLRASVGLDVFVLGYPLSLGIMDLPLWKRASIASEPELDVDGRPLIYVDTATAKGMSGGPVLARSLFGLDTQGGAFMNATPATTFIGVYSGRITSEEPFAAQIGRVWKARVLDQILWSRRGGLSCSFATTVNHFAGYGLYVSSDNVSASERRTGRVSPAAGAAAGR